MFIEKEEKEAKKDTSTKHRNKQMMKRKGIVDLLTQLNF
jgi:hypothetical protein